MPRDPRWTFSGHTEDPFALHDVAAAATRVRVLAGGCLVYAVDAADDVLAPDTRKYAELMSSSVLADVTDPAEIAALAGLLVVQAPLAEVAIMTPGAFALELRDQRGDVVSVVGVTGGPWLRWGLWRSDQRMRDPVALFAWLRRNGVAVDDRYER